VKPSLNKQQRVIHKKPALPPARRIVLAGVHLLSATLLRSTISGQDRRSLLHAHEASAHENLDMQD